MLDNAARQSHQTTRYNAKDKKLQNLNTKQTWSLSLHFTVSKSNKNISTETKSEPFRQQISLSFKYKKNQINTKRQPQHIKRGQHNPKPLERKLQTTNPNRNNSINPYKFKLLVRKQIILSPTSQKKEIKQKHYTNTKQNQLYYH